MRVDLKHFTPQNINRECVLMELLITDVSRGIISEYTDIGSPCFML